MNREEKQIRTDEAYFNGYIAGYKSAVKEMKLKLRVMNGEQ